MTPTLPTSVRLISIAFALAVVALVATPLIVLASRIVA